MLSRENDSTFSEIFVRSLAVSSLDFVCGSPRTVHRKVTSVSRNATSRDGATGRSGFVVFAEKTWFVSVGLRYITYRVQPLHCSLSIRQSRQSSGQEHQRLPQEIEERQ